WRKGSDYVGWAPLPPEARFDQRTGIRNWSDNYYDVGPDQYCFVASREFGAPRVEQTLLPPERNITIINQTTNVTNITYKNTTIVNEGPNYEEVRSVSREPMQRYRLERNTDINVAAGEPRPEVRGETVVIAAPVIGISAGGERPASVKQTIAAAAVELGWGAVANQEEAKTARAKMKAEATPPPNAPSKKFVRAERTMRESTAAQTPESSAPPSRPATATATATASATATATASASVTPVATAPKPSMTPRGHPSVPPSATPSASAASVLSPATSPTASQRRGRLIVPNGLRSPRPLPSVTPSPQSNASAIPQGSVTATETPVADKVPSSPTMIPPRGSPIAPAVSASQGPMKSGQFKSQAKRFDPGKVQPMPSESPSPRETSTPAQKSSPGATTTPEEKLTKQEKKEQRREERREMRHERKAGNQSPSPTATP
ncbi:MAG TPA: hypothetical protein VFA58_06430, partial [Chthoniobacterales bacterium]|nr:hypothetical protein [Chthoniobacterales bacterium]